MPHMPYFATITQITKNKVRVHFPIRKFIWFDKSRVNVPIRNFVWLKAARP